MTAVRTFSIAVGVILMSLGLWGMFTGADSHDISVFGVNAVHDLAHIFTGGFAIIAGLSGSRSSSITCIVFGALYGTASVLGFFHFAPVVNALNLNPADNCLHLAVGSSSLFMAGSEKTG